jgi:hypothetical protein
MDEHLKELKKLEFVHFHHVVASNFYFHLKKKN